VKPFGRGFEFGEDSLNEITGSFLCRLSLHTEYFLVDSRRLEDTMEAVHCENQHCSEPDTLREVSYLRSRVGNTLAIEVYYAY